MSAKQKLRQQYTYICASTDEGAPAGVSKSCQWTREKRLELHYLIKCALSHLDKPIVFGAFPVTFAMVVHTGPKHVRKGEHRGKAGSTLWAKAAEWSYTRQYHHRQVKTLPKSQISPHVVSTGKVERELATQKLASQPELQQQSPRLAPRLTAPLQSRQPLTQTEVAAGFAVQMTPRQTIACTDVRWSVYLTLYSVFLVWVFPEDGTYLVIFIYE